MSSDRGMRKKATKLQQMADELFDKGQFKTLQSSIGLFNCLFRSLSLDLWRKSLIILWGVVLAQTCAHTEVTLSIAECWAAFPKTELLVAFSIFRITGSAAIEEVQTQPIASVLVGENNCRRQHAVYRSLLILEEAFVFL